MFPFWTLKKMTEEMARFRCPDRRIAFEELLVAGKPRDMLWTDKFTPSHSRMVVATRRMRHSGFEARAISSGLLN